MAKAGVYTPVIDRMYARLAVDSDGCWVWPGAVNGDKRGVGGYGQIRDTELRKTLLVHLVSYEHHIGAIPTGMEVDHLCHGDDCRPEVPSECKHRRCWNPGHLAVTTHADNSARSNARSHVTKRTRICQRGHTLTDQNVYRGVRGTGTEKEQCAQCVREEGRRTYQYYRSLGYSPTEARRMRGRRV